MLRDRCNSAPESVTVIMPTLARSARAVRLRRALASILDQTGVRPVALVVVNGDERDSVLVDELTGMDGVRAISRREAHLGDALLEGRRQVDTPWFAELDDDDVLLPGALAQRVQRLRSSPRAAAVVSNGWAESNSGRRKVIGDTVTVGRDPLGALARLSWLSPGGALFRTDSIGPEFFTDIPRYLEWTCIALRLACSNHAVEFLDEVDFTHFEDAPDGLWDSPECVLGLPGAIRHLLADEVPDSLRDAFLRRLASACNAAAILERARGQLGQAWHWHLRCIASGGWRYLGFTRRLLSPSMVRGTVGS